MKKCPYCQNENEDNSVFCFNCGAKLTEDEAKEVQETANIETAEASAEDSAEENTQQQSATPEGDTAAAAANNESGGKFSWKSWKSKIIPVAAVLLVLILIVAIINAARPGKYTEIKNNAVFLPLKDEAVAFFDKKKAVKIDDTNLSGTVNLQNTAIIYTNSDKELFYLGSNDKSPKKIASDVTTKVFSENGKMIYYMADTELYSVSTGSTKPKKIDSDVTSFIVSPDGKTAAYMKDGEVYVNKGKAEKKDLSEENGVALRAVSNGGKYLYYDKEGKLYVMKGKESVSLGELSNSNVTFNADKSQVLYNKENGTYLSINGKDGEKVISKNYSSVVTPALSTRIVKDFQNALVMADSGLYNIGKNTEKTKKILSNIEGSGYLSKDGKRFIYKKGDSIYLLTKFNDENAEPKELNRDVKDIVNYTTNPDAKKVCFINADEELYYVNGTSKPKKVTDDVTSLYASFDKKSFYTIKDDELYATVNGGKLKKVNGIEDVIAVVSMVNCDICLTDEGVYRSTGGNKFEKLSDSSIGY